jgi:MFS family permease
MRLESIGQRQASADLEFPLLGDDGDEEYVDESVGLTPALSKSVGVALISSFMYGYNGANMNTQAGVQRVALGIPVGGGAAADNVWSLCVSLFCIGALLGCNLSGSLADTWGRKKYLLVSAVIFAVGGLLEAACALPAAPADGGPAFARIALLVAGRLVTGVACGGATVVVPMYLGEVSPAHLRGTLGTAFQLTSVVAMFAAQVLGLGQFLGTAALWPSVFGAVAVPALLQLLLGGLLIESPRWHCMTGNIEDAQATLCLLRDAQPTDDVVVEELDVMIQSAEAAQSGGQSGGPTFGQLLRPPTRYPLAIAVSLMIVQQFSGINSVRARANRSARSRRSHMLAVVFRSARAVVRPSAE